MKEVYTTFPHYSFETLQWLNFMKYFSWYLWIIQSDKHFKTSGFILLTSVMNKKTQKQIGDNGKNN